MHIVERHVYVSIIFSSLSISIQELLAIHHHEYNTRNSFYIYIYIRSHAGCV